MARSIKQLDDKTINKIAAGEVVERPYSVVKELVENSIDAGSTSIIIEIKSGGKKYIRITDNGSGIQREDLGLAFLRHSTSKISTVEDLEMVRSLGFRGEALASISSVSLLEIVTKTKDDATGIQANLQGGEITNETEVGCPNGTTIIVKNLFFNVPVRQKFLKSDNAEASQISNIVYKLALSNPNISFKYIKDNKMILKTPGNGNIQTTIYSLFGKEFSKSLFKIDYNGEDIKINGAISKPSFTRGNRGHQYIFVNGRYIKDENLSRAVEDAYKTLLPINRFPIFILFLDIDSSQIDVNVHPTKTEIRFDRQDKMYSVLNKTVKEVLRGENLIPEVKITRKKKKDQGEQKTFIDTVDNKNEKKINNNPKIANNNKDSKNPNDVSAKKIQVIDWTSGSKKKDTEKRDIDNVDTKSHTIDETPKETINRTEEPTSDTTDKNRINTIDYKPSKSTESSTTVSKNIDTIDTVDKTIGRNNPSSNTDSSKDSNKYNKDYQDYDNSIDNDLIHDENDIGYIDDDYNGDAGSNDDNNRSSDNSHSGLNESSSRNIDYSNGNSYNKSINKTDNLTKDNTGYKNSKEVLGAEDRISEKIAKSESEENATRATEHQIDTPEIENQRETESPIRTDIGIENNEEGVEGTSTREQESPKNEFPTKQPRNILPELEIIGSLFDTYILAQDKVSEVFYLIDQHAAHERIMYEDLVNQFKKENIVIQELLAPEIIELTHSEVEVVNENLTTFENLGFLIESFGINSIILRGVPLVFGEPDSKGLFLDILDKLGSNVSSRYDLRMEKIMKMACTSAIKAGDNIKNIEVNKLLEDLRCAEEPFTCPHGRPIIIKMTKYELEKKFKRVQ